jgi:hypothetical protein
VANPHAGRLEECAGQVTQGQRQIGWEQSKVGERESSRLGGSLVIVEFVVGQESVDGRRSFDGTLLITEGVWMEGVGAVVEHSLGKPRCHGLDVEIAQHGIR